MTDRILTNHFTRTYGITITHFHRERYDITEIGATPTYNSTSIHKTRQVMHDMFQL